MFSKKEREYLLNPTNFNKEYSRVLICRIKKKVVNSVNDLILFVELKTVFNTFKFDSIIERTLTSLTI